MARESVSVAFQHGLHAGCVIAQLPFQSLEGVEAPLVADAVKEAQTEGFAV